MSDDERTFGDVNMDEDEETALEIAALQSQELLPQPKKDFINHKAALRTLLEEISQQDLQWIQRCDVTSLEPIAVEKADDDLDRELKFYQQGLEAAIQGKTEVQKAGVPFSRPDDYFAEMVKSDTHMARIRQKLLDQQKAIQNSEEAKKQRELRKYGKKIEQEKLKEREDQKKATLDKIATIKKRLRSGDMGDADDFNIDLESDDDTGGGSGRMARNGNRAGKGGKPMANKKRQQKNERFGFGGKKRGLKNNTADSTNDMTGFSVKRNKGANFSQPSKKGSAKRPGKARRQQKAR